MEPKFVYEAREERSGQPTWAAEEYVSLEHREIFQQTENIPGWQELGDTHKLYEMAYFFGDVILEIGVYSGRSAVVQLRGALSAGRRPQFYGVDISPEAIANGRQVLASRGLEDFVYLFQGDLREFASTHQITPSMVFLDGAHDFDSVDQDLEVLSGFLASNTPLFCHDFSNKENETGEYGVTRACEKWEQRGFLRFLGVFGCSALYLTTPFCQRPRGGLTRRRFDELKQEPVVFWEERLLDWLRRKCRKLRNLAESSWGYRA